MPTPTPTAQEIQDVRKIAALSSYAAAATIIGDLEDVEWTDALDLITEWNKVRLKTTELSGGRLGIRTDPKAKRLLIRNEMRRILGLSPFSELEAETGTVLLTSLVTELERG